MQEGTKKILKHIAIIVLVPTALVATYYGAKFVHKKYKDNKAKRDNKKNENSTKGSNSSAENIDNAAKTTATLNKDGSVDTTGMSKYTVSIPFKLQPELFSNGKFFDAISKVNYSFISEKVDNDEKNNPSIIKVEIMALPSDLRQLRQIAQQINNEIIITPTVA